MNYITSKDYDKLIEHLDAGRKIVIWTPIYEYEMAFLSKIGKRRCYHIGHMGFFTHDHNRVKEILTEKNIEFIEPTIL